MSFQSEGSKLTREMEAVTIDDLMVDHRYQRALDQRLVEKILDQWDMVAADAIAVSRRKNGDLYIVNGQHRAAAAKLAGETEILAFVYEGLNIKQEADLRLKSNNRRADTSQERFHAQVTKGDPESLAIVALLENYETWVNRTANSHTGVNCVSTLETLYRESPELLDRSLRTLKEAHGSLAAEVVTTPPLRAVFWFLKVHHGEYHYKSLVERMRESGTEELFRRARSHQAVAGGALWLNYYRALVEGYNHRRAQHTRLELKTKYSAALQPHSWEGRRKAA